MGIELHNSYQFTEIVEISLFHAYLSLVIELKAESPNRNDVQTLDIFYFDYDGYILLEFLLFQSEKKIV